MAPLSVYDFVFCSQTPEEESAGVAWDGVVCNFSVSFDSQHKSRIDNMETMVPAILVRNARLLWRWRSCAAHFVSGPARKRRAKKNNNLVLPLSIIVPGVSAPPETRQ
jgi:hypothetical protein